MASTIYITSTILSIFISIFAMILSIFIYRKSKTNARKIVSGLVFLWGILFLIAIIFLIFRFSSLGKIIVYILVALSLIIGLLNPRKIFRETMQ